ncbi:hypothetical protein BLM15_30265 (plasmid) [Bosea sp. Tri-49]|nr:hypothetical protein BLM15_30265 [Bosea sp. Tri-49]
MRAQPQFASSSTGSLQRRRGARGLSRKGVVCVKPKLAAEITYRGWTHDEKLRHASFKGPREKADEAKIYRLP